ncbi:MAG: tRNA 2-thiouridine(34) synthase MnmA [Thermoleophilia bacterium]|nr:tRNA 2-thiouridine(34) synthase MnmA [Thermoleophilia bacterium]
MPRPASPSHRRSLLVAVSGGVDSTVALHLLKAAGHEVQAVHLRLWAGPDRRAGGSAEGLRRARAAAGAAGAPFEVLDDEEGFARTVVEPFAAAYLAGETPNPCVVCNRRRFTLLVRRAAELGLDGVASGHYAGLVRRGGRPYVGRAADRAKDQSYMLWMLAEETLERLELPLCAATKDEIRAVARRAGLAAAEQAESQEVCFAPEGYRRYLASRGVEPRKGRFIDRHGRTLGEHDGQWNFTIGQRRGIEVPDGPWYVLCRRAAANEVVIGRADELWARRVLIRDVVDRGIGDGEVASPAAVAGGAAPSAAAAGGPASPAAAGSPEVATDGDEATLLVQLRYRSPAVPVRTLEQQAEGRLLVGLETPFAAPAPGQSAVFYRGARVVGGGVLDVPPPETA